MKNLILLLLMGFTMTSFSQTLRIDKVDDFTGNVTRKTDYYEVGKSTQGRLSCSSARVGDTVFIELWTTAKQGCAGGVSNYVIFLFEDGTTYRNDKDENKINCDERASSFYVVSPTDFAGKTVSRIRFCMTDGYIDYDWSGSYSISSLLKAVQ